MNAFDILIIVILGVCLIRGLFRGFVKEISSIIGVMAGFYAAYTYYPRFGIYLKSWISNTGYLNIISFVAVFCIVLVAVNFLGLLIRLLLKISLMGWVDRFFGACFGAIKGILIAAVLLVAFASFLPRGTPVIRKSLLSPHISAISREMSRFVTKKMKHSFAANIRGLKKEWKKQR